MSGDVTVGKWQGADYHWNLKSTSVDRGRVLMALGAEWCGEGEEVRREDVPGIAAEQLLQLLVWLAEEGGEGALARTMGVLMEIAPERAEEDEDEAGMAVVAMLADLAAGRPITG